MKQNKQQLPHLLPASITKENQITPHVVESFRVDEFTGSAGVTIPIETTACRGTELGLSLHYQQGVMNSAFGIGFSMEQPKFIRADNRRRPCYQDEKDIFEFTPEGELTLKEKILSENGETWVYQPITEAAFTKLEFHKKGQASYWRTISAHGTKAIYGRSEAARVGTQTLTSGWFLEEAEDSRGNKIRYIYEKTGTNPYLRRICYGNYIKDGAESWSLEVRFLYKERSDRRTSYRSGFAVTTDRLCTAVQMIHHIEGEHLVRSTDFVYQEKDGMSMLAEVRVTGFQTLSDESLYKETMPPVTFSYSRFKAEGSFHELDFGGRKTAALFKEGRCLFLDLRGEGIAGLLYQSGNTLFYCAPLGNGAYGAPEPVHEFPIHRDLAEYSFGSISGEIRYDLIVEKDGYWGYYPWEKGRWGNFQQLPGHPLAAAESLDLQGDGRNHRFFIKHGQMIYTPSLKENGYGMPAATLLPEGFPDSSQASPGNYVGFQDLFGDGLLHRLRVENGRLECWPNLGYGKFGEKVSMKGAPYYEEGLWTERLYFADLDGSGCCDLIYLKDEGMDIYRNRSGTSFEKPFFVRLPEKYARGDVLQFADIKGDGRSNIIFLKEGRDAPCFYYEFEDGRKPYLLQELDTKTGLSYGFSYGSSVDQYLAAKKEGRPWQEGLPLSVTVVTEIEKRDLTANTSLRTKYHYRDGKYHQGLRRFMGFAYVEAIEQAHHNYEWYEETEAAYHKNWYYTGTEKEGQRAESLKGHLRKSESGRLTDKGYLPYAGEIRQYLVKELMPPRADTRGVCQVLPSQAVSLRLEGAYREAAVNQELSLAWDTYGNVLKSASSYFFLENENAKTMEQLLEQGESSDHKCLLTLERYLNLTGEEYRISIPLETKEYEIRGIVRDPADLEEELEEALRNTIAYQQDFPEGEKSARLTQWIRAFYWDEDGTKALPHGQSTQKALLHHTETAVIEASMLNEVYGGRITAEMMESDGGCQLQEDHFWNPGNVISYDPDCFYLPCKETAPENSLIAVRSEVEYDSYGLLPVKFTQYDGEQALRTESAIQYEGMYVKQVCDCNGNIKEAFRGPLGQTEILFSHGTILGEQQGSGSLADYKMAALDFEKILKEPQAYIQNASSYSYTRCTDGSPVCQALLENTGETILRRAGFFDGSGNQIKEILKTGESWNVLNQCCFDARSLKICEYLPFTSQEPFKNTFDHQPEKLIHYDAGRRVIREDRLLWELPDQTADYGYTETKYQLAGHTTWDLNGTLKDAPYYKRFMEQYPQDADWKQKVRKDVLEKSACFYGNHRQFFSDSQGHLVREIPYEGLEICHLTDMAGKTRKTYSMEEGKAGHIRLEYVYGMDGTLLRTSDTAGGTCMELMNLYGLPVHRWDGEGVHKKMEYDPLMRLTAVASEEMGVMERYLYGEYSADSQERNLAGRLVKKYDEAGMEEYALYGIEGNILEKNRKLCKEYQRLPDWKEPTETALQEEEYKETFAHDWLGRTTAVTHPSGDTVYQDYSADGLVSELKIKKAGEDTVRLLATFSHYPSQMLKAIAYGNGVKRLYQLEKLTQQLASVKTLDGQGKTVEEFHYFFDPMGNISHVCDRNGEAVYYKQQKAAPEWDYTYDAAYRLVSASGRERARGAGTADLEKLAAYNEQYQYDLAGNMTKMSHAAVDNCWSRNMEYAEDSCRLIREGGSALAYDENGNLCAHSGIRAMKWKNNRLSCAELITREDEAGDCEYYLYDQEGKRVRKVLERKTAAGIEVTDTRYLGNGYEEKRITANEVILERNCINLFCGSMLTASVYSWKTDSLQRECGAGATRLHYKASDPLNVSVMDFDESGELIVRREYYPFGAEAFCHGTTQAKLLSDYGYCSKEKDSATGFYYMGQRYYSDRYGRFLSPDALQFVKIEDFGSLNRYQYCRNNPRNYVDPYGNDIYYFIYQNAVGRDREDKDHDRAALEQIASRAGVPVHAVCLNNWDEFTHAWNTISGTKGEHTVILRPHSNTSSILGRPDRNHEHDPLHFSGLNKNKSIGRLFLLSCNAAFGNEYNRISVLGRNITRFAYRMSKVGRIIAARGSVAARTQDKGFLYRCLGNDYYKDIVKFSLHTDDTPFSKQERAAIKAVPRGFYCFQRTGQNTFTAGFWRAEITTTQIADAVVPRPAPPPRPPAGQRAANTFQRAALATLRH